MWCYIYKITKKDAFNDDMVYIGSTIDPDHRWETHKSKHNNPKIKCYNNKLYTYMRDNGGFYNFKMEIIDEIEIPLMKCVERDNYENKIIIEYDGYNKLNTIRVGTNWKKNWKELRALDDTYKNKANISTKKWAEANREQINAKKREKIPCNVCGPLIGRSGMARHKKRFNCI